MNNYNENVEKNLLDMIKQKELADKRLLTMEIVIGALSSIILFVLIFVASFVEMADWIRILLIIVGVVLYYNWNLICYKNRTRYMRCPKCNQKSWNKKVISK